MLALSLAVSGCASLEPLLADLSGRPGPRRPARGATALPLPDSYTLEVRAPEPLRSTLAKHLDLARFATPASPAA